MRLAGLVSCGAGPRFSSAGGPWPASRRLNRRSAVIVFVGESVVAGALIREARLRAGLTQAQLARRAGVTQSVVSAYESGTRQPSVPTLTRLVKASGSRLDMRVSRPASPLRRLHGPLGQLVRQHRAEMVQTAAQHGATNLRVFGSVARGEDDADSDIDLLVDLGPDTGLLRLGRLSTTAAVMEGLLGLCSDSVGRGLGGGVANVTSSAPILGGVAGSR